METQNKFNKRAFVSIGMLLSGIGLPYSGWMNHIFGFAPMSPERHVWMTVHNILGLLFVIFSISHIRLNWKSLSGHLRKAAQMILSREALYAISLILFFITIAVLHGKYMNR